MIKKSTLILALLTALLAITNAATIYVTPTGAGLQDGSSWANALPGSQFKVGLDSAAAGTNFWVATGTYYPDTAANNLASFNLKNGVGLYGGFNGTETLLSQRNVAVNTTILSGDLNQSGGWDGADAYHVVYSANNDNSAVLSGFTIELGNAAGYYSNFNWGIGGGLLLDGDNAAPTVDNCVFDNNFAYYGGGAIYGQGGNTVNITNCTFTNNQVANYGGALMMYQSSNVTNCIFTNNNGYGVILCFGGATMNITNCTVYDNVPFYEATLWFAFSTLNVTNSIIWSDNGTQDIDASQATANINYSDIHGGWAGTGNISADPKFADISGFQLLACSPCINSGTDTGAPASDIGGNARPFGSSTDMGAWEFLGTPSSITPTISINASSTIICPGTNVTFNSTISGGGNSPTYLWMVNGSSAGTNAAAFSTTALNNGDIVTCNLVSSEVCAVPDTTGSNGIAVQVYPQVMGTINGNTTSCGSVTLTAGGGNLYIWSGGNSINSDSNTFTTSGSYSVLIEDSNTGCFLVDTVIVTANNPPTAGITGTASGCGVVSLTATGGSHYAWSDGNAPSNPMNTFTNVGTEVVTVTVSDNNNCSATASESINVLPGVTPLLSGTTMACDSVTLTASGGANYQWSGGNNPGAATNTFTSSGIYNVTVSTGGCSTILTANVRVTTTPAVPTGTATPDTICTGHAVALSAVSPGNLINWWTAPTGGTLVGSALSGNSFIDTPSVPGNSTFYAEAEAYIADTVVFNYTGALQSFTVPNGATFVTVTATGGQGGATQYPSFNQYGGLGAVITGSFNVTPGHVIDLLVGGQGGTGQVWGSGGGGGTFVWDSSNNNALMIAAGGGGGAAWYSIHGSNASTTVVPTPGGVNGGSAGAGGTGGNGGGGGNANTAYDYEIYFAATGGGGAGWFSSGDTGQQGDLTQSEAYGGGGGIYPLAAVNPGAGGYGAPGVPAAGGYGGGGGAGGNGGSGGGGGGYNGGGGGSMWNGGTWGNGGGGGSFNTGTSQMASATNTGNGSITIIYYTSACTSARTPVTFNVDTTFPVPSISGVTTACGNVSLTASGGDAYAWSGGNNPNSAVNTFTSTGTSTYVVTVSLSACAAVDSQQVTVKPQPTVKITPADTNTICAGDSITLQSTIDGQGPGTGPFISSYNGYGYQVSCNCPTGYVAVGYQGYTGYYLYQFQLACSKLNRDGTIDTAIVLTAPNGGLAVGNPTGLITAGPNNALTKFDLYWAYYTTGIQGYAEPVSSIAADGYAGQNIMSPAFGSLAGTYYYSSGSFTAPPGTVITGMQAYDPNDGYYSSGVSFNYTPISNFLDQFTWSTGDTTPSITVKNPGNYSLSVTNGLGCTGISETAQVIVDTVSISVTGDTVFCYGDSVLLTSSAGHNFLWSDGETTQSITVKSTGTYSVTADGCVSVNTIHTLEHPGSSLSTNGDTTFCPGFSLQISAVPTGQTYLWNTGQTTDTISVSAAGTYTVSVTDTFGCILINTINTHISPLPVPQLASNTGFVSCPYYGGGNVYVNNPDPRYVNYLWSDSATVALTNFPGAGIASVTVTDALGCTVSNSALITSGVQGDPTVFGLNVWNVYAFNDGGQFIGSNCWSYQYSGYYIDTNFQFNTNNYWCNGCSPSDAPGYVGCPVQQVNNSWSALRQGFPCGLYEIDVPGHDDAAQLFINGTLVWVDSGCCDVNPNVWRGILDASSQVVFRVTQGYGGAYGVLNLIPLSFDSIITSGNATICSGQAVTLTSNAASSYLWSNGQTTQSITVNASGNYSVSISNAGCSFGSDTVAVNTSNATISALVNASPGTLICHLGPDTVTLTASPNSKYLWNTGDTTQSISTVNTGSYKVIVTNSVGCTDTSSIINVHFGVAPPTPFVAGNDTVCAGSAANLIASGLAPGGQVASFDGDYAQYLEVVQTLPTTNFTVEFWFNTTDPYAGLFSVTDGTDGSPGSNGYDREIFLINGNPYVRIYSDPNYDWSPNYSLYLADGNWHHIAYVVDTLVGQQVFIDGLSQPYTSSYDHSDFTWATRFDMGFAQDAYDVFLYGSEDNVRIWNRPLTQGAIDSSMMLETPLDTAGLIYFAKLNGDLNPVVGDTASAFNGISFGAPNAYTYTWTGPNAPAPSTSETQTINAVNAGPTYTVEASLGICSSSPSLPVSVIVDSSALSITGALACGVDSAVLTAHYISNLSDSITGYQWSTGDSAASITAWSAGPYSLTVTNSRGCSASASVNVVIAPLPDVTAVASADTVCNGTTVTITASGAATYTWDNGNDGSGSIDTALIFERRARRDIAVFTFDVTGTDTNGCQNTATATVYDVTDITFANASANLVCPGSQVTLFGDGTALTYTWSNGVTDNVPFIIDSTTSYTLTGTSYNGCATTDTVTIYTFPSTPMTVTASPDSVCPGGSVTLTGSAPYPYTWDNGVTDGVAFVPDSTTTYTASGTDGNGCTMSASITVVVNPLPVITAIASADTVCNGITVTITASGAVTYSWDNGNDANGSIDTALIFERRARRDIAVFTFDVTGTDINGCQNTATATVYDVTDVTFANASATTVCPGSQVTLFGDGTALTYTWSNGATDNVPFIIDSTTFYTVTGTSYNGCTSTDTVTIYTLPTPPVTAIASPDTVCAGSPVTLTGSGAVSYVWSAGVTDGVSFIPASSGSYSVTGTDGNSCTGTANISVTVNSYPVAGINGNTTGCGSVSLTATGGDTYSWSGGNTPNQAANTFINNGNYTVTVTSNGCSSTASASVTVNSSITAGINGTTTGCGSVSLTATGGGTYSWSGGSTPNSAGNTFTTGGNYTVTVTSNGCSSTASAAVSVNTIPTAGINGTTTGCGSVSLTATGGGTYSWSGGSTPNSAGNTFTTGGNYTVTVTSNGCSSTATVAVNVNTIPTAGINGTTTGCGSVSLTATGGGTYSWSGGSTPNSAGNTFTIGGNYTVTVTSSGCSSTATVAVNVNTIPTAGINGTTTGCGSVSLTATGGGTYSWSGGSTPNSAGNTFTTGGNYTVTVTSNGCSSTASASVSVNTIPTAGINGTTTGCGSVSLTATGGTTYHWSGGSTPNSAGNTFTTGGNYTVTVTSNGCSSTASAAVNVNTIPTAGINGTTTGCGSVSLTATGGGTYSWSGGSTPNSAGNIFTSGGNYTVTVTSNGCSSTATVAVNVNTIPTAGINGTTTGCGSVSLTATGGGTYSWSGGSTPNSAGNTFTTGGNYTVTVTNNGCSSTASAAVSVNTIPTAGITGTTTGCGSVSLTATGGATYHWSGGSTPNSAGNTFTTGGNYTVTVTNNGCSSTASVSVNVNGSITAGITGATTGCGSVVLTATGGTTYHWNGGSSPNTAMNAFTSSGTYKVTVTSGGACSATASKSVTVHPNPVAGISGNGTGCVTVSLTATGGGTYAWSGGNSPHSASNTFTNSATYTVTVTNSFGCSATSSKVVTVNPNPVATITGTTTGCNTVSLTAAGGTSYSWSGGSSTHTAANTFTSSGTYRVTVTNPGGCSSTASIAVSVNTPLATPVFNGDIDDNYTSGVCGGSTHEYQINQVVGAATYTWTAPTGCTITDGLGHTGNPLTFNGLNWEGEYEVQITFPANFVSGNVSVYATNACGNSPTSTLLVKSRLSTPAGISGPVSGVCHTSNQVYSIAAVTNATSYTWTVPTGATITSNSGTSIHVSFGNNFTGTGYITVKANNSCGSSAADSLYISALPAQPGGINGATAACKTERANVYSIAAVPGATSYTWTITGGAVFVGSTTGNSVTVNFTNAAVGNATLSVKAVNACGNSTVKTLAISVTAKCTGKDDEDAGSQDEQGKTSTAQEIKTQELKAYPNPTSGLLNLEFSASANHKFTFMAFDIMGHVIINESYAATEGDNMKQLDFNGLAKGVYILKAIEEGVEVKTLRIVVQ